MGILGNKGRVRDSCSKNPDSGEVVCKRVRVNPDNTEVEIAGFTMVADASCNPVMTDSFENEDGELNRLEQKFLPKMKSKCRNTPSDY